MLYPLSTPAWIEQTNEILKFSNKPGATFLLTSLLTGCECGIKMVLLQEYEDVTGLE